MIPNKALAHLGFMTAIIMSYSCFNEGCGVVLTHGPASDSKERKEETQRQESKHDQSVTNLFITQIRDTQMAQEE